MAIAQRLKIPFPPSVGKSLTKYDIEISVLTLLKELWTLSN